MTNVAKRVLVVGCGSIGSRHARNLKTLGLEDVHLYDADVAKAASLARELEASPHSSLDGALSVEPDLTVVATPTSRHLEVAMAATETGSNLFVEKPLANSLEGVDRLIDTVHTQKLVALVGCNMRFHPGVQRLHDVIQQGSLGSVVAVRAFAGQYLPDWHPSEDYRNGYSARSSLGGGVILDTIHEIDYVSWMLGGVSEVACFSGQLSHLEIDTEDVAAIILRGSSGQLGEVHLDYVQRNYSRGCEVIGDRGTARWDFMANSLIILREQGDVSDNAAPPGWVLNDMYLDEFRHLLACLDGVEEPMLDLPAGRDVLRIALAAKESSSQRCVVSLGER